MTSLCWTINPSPVISTLFPVAIKTGWKYRKLSFCPVRKLPERRPWNFCSQLGNCDGIQPFCPRQECSLIQNPASLKSDDILDSPLCRLSADTCMCEKNIVSDIDPPNSCWWLQRVINTQYILEVENVRAGQSLQLLVLLSDGLPTHATVEL